MYAIGYAGPAMGVKGGLAGALVGLAVGGPIGALLGGLAGSKLEEGPAPRRRRRGEEDDAEEPPARAPSRREAHAMLQVATISLLAKLAKADGAVAPAEIRVVDGFFKRSLGLAGGDRKAAIRIFEAAKASRHSAREFARQAAQAFEADRRALLGLLGTMVELAAADGRWDPAEDRVLREVAAELGLAEAELERLKALHFKDPGADYTVLGLTPDASDEAVRKAYRQLAKDFHPDRIAAKDLPPAFVEFARTQFARVQAAYDRICAARKPA